MTKERLEELIKQGGWIWILDKGCRFGLQVSDKFFVKDNFLRSELGTKYAKLNDIFETKERAEWALKTVAERTERFEPPMWEEIYQKYVFRFIHKNTFCMLRVEINRNIEILQDLKTIKIWDATKENYEKACEIVRDLFTGKK